jgi:hypothetical protein
VYDPANHYVTKVTSGTDVGNATLAISSAFTNMGTLGGTHWFYEMEIPVSVFGTHWQEPARPKPSTSSGRCCAPTTSSLDPPAAAVPEPASLALLGGLGLACPAPQTIKKP